MEPGQLKSIILVSSMAAQTLAQVGTMQALLKGEPVSTHPANCFCRFVAAISTNTFDNQQSYPALTESSV